MYAAFTITPVQPQLLDNPAVIFDDQRFDADQHPACIRLNVTGSDDPRILGACDSMEMQGLRVDAIDLFVGSVP